MEDFEDEVVVFIMEILITARMTSTVMDIGEEVEDPDLEQDLSHALDQGKPRHSQKTYTLFFNFFEGQIQDVMIGIDTEEGQDLDQDHFLVMNQGVIDHEVPVQEMKADESELKAHLETPNCVQQEDQGHHLDGHDLKVEVGLGLKMQNNWRK